MKNASLFVIATFVLFQVQQAYSFYSVFQAEPAPAIPAPAEPRVEQDAGVVQQHAQQRFRLHHGAHKGVGGIGVGHLQVHIGGHKLLQHYQNLGMGYFPQPIELHHNQRKEFYKDCGTSVRHCEWVQEHHSQPVVKTLSNKFANVQRQVIQQATAAPVQMQYSCITHSHICVGNTENCVSNSSCDVAVKISEMKMEANGQEKFASISSVSHLNNCHIAGQSVTDASRMPQMLFAVGFETYDETGKLECRRPKASDFKLVFLWQNSTVEESEENKNGRCHPKPEHHHVVHHFNQEIMNTVTLWPTVCNAMENREETFNLKSFLNSRAPLAEYTSAFSPPFSFADNYEPQFSSNGMVISGVVPN